MFAPSWSLRQGRAAWLPVAALAVAFTPARALAQDMGAPPPDADALVKAPSAAASAPAKDEGGLDGTTASLSAGGMQTTGNSRQLAATANGTVDTRFGANGVGFKILGNYARGAAEDEPVEVTAENVQGRLRYDRYLVDRLSLFLINTGRHDRFQGLDFRYNLDPGVKYIFAQAPESAAWVELGYDYQFDVRRKEARVQVDAAGEPLPGAPLLDKTETDHSARGFLGVNHAFNDSVTFAAGVEYLQSFVDTKRSRVNFDALFASQIAGGFALGVGFTARYDNAPLPTKEKLDTATTLSLIYSLSTVEKPAAPEPPPPPAPAAAPASPAPTTKAAAPEPTPVVAPAPDEAPAAPNEAPEAPSSAAPAPDAPSAAPVESPAEPAAPAGTATDL